MSDDRPRVGISACLLGEPVRFDAGHKRDRFLVETLGPQVEWIKVCPEVEAGFGTPREPMHLARTGRALESGSAAGIALVVTVSGEDVTARLGDYSRVRIEALMTEGLDGYVLKKDSPSCGPDQVKVYSGDTVERVGRGLFAEVLMALMPDLPVEDEERLADPQVRDRFLSRVFARCRLRTATREV